jgi:hypothetical protein
MMKFVARLWSIVVRGVPAEENHATDYTARIQDDDITSKF